MKIYIYNENCVMKGHSVPQGVIDLYDGNPDDGGDWSFYEGNEVDIEQQARLLAKQAKGLFDRCTALTLLHEGCLWHKDEAESLVYGPNCCECGEQLPHWDDVNFDTPRDKLMALICSDCYSESSK